MMVWEKPSPTISRINLKEIDKLKKSTKLRCKLQTRVKSQLQEHFLIVFVPITPFFPLLTREFYQS